jgi:hypothetical protein
VIVSLYGGPEDGIDLIADELKHEATMFLDGFCHFFKVAIHDPGHKACGNKDICSFKSLPRAFFINSGSTRSLLWSRLSTLRMGLS